MVLSRQLLLSVLLLCAGLSALASQATGHVSDCHTTHACPSDNHTYVWSDGAGGLWDCAAAGTVDVDPYLDTYVVVQGALTWYCRAAGSPTAPPSGSPPPPPPPPREPAPGGPTADPAAPPPTGSSSGPPALALSDAKSALRQMIRRRTGRVAHNLSYGCERIDEFTWACRPRWTDRAYAYAGRSTVRTDDAGTISSSFSGTRTRRTCVARHGAAKAGARECSRRLSW